jgi:hypothetical protein
MENVQFAKVQKEDIKMFLSVAGLALALQFGPPAQSLKENVPLAQEVQYRVPVKPPPCGHGWDVSARDGMCYPNGYLAPQDQAARQYQYRRYRDYYAGPRRRHYDDY